LAIPIWFLRGRRRYYNIQYCSLLFHLQRKGCLLQCSFKTGLSLQAVLIELHLIHLYDFVMYNAIVVSLLHTCLIFSVRVRGRQQICVEKNGTKDVAAITKEF